MAKYCTRKAEGPFLLLTWDLSQPFDRENLINLQPEGIICPFFFKEKSPQPLGFGSTLAKAGHDLGAVFPPQ